MSGRTISTLPDSSLDALRGLAVLNAGRLDLSDRLRARALRWALRFESELRRRAERELRRQSMIETYKLTCHRCGKEVCIPAAEPEARVVAPCPHACGGVLDIQ